MPAPVCLLVNPVRRRRTGAKAAPGVERRLRELGLEVRRGDTRDLDHARALAREAARAGETVAVLSGDGMIGAVADALRELPGAVLGVLPGGRGNDLARVLGNLPRSTRGVHHDRAGSAPRDGRRRGERARVRGDRLGGLRLRCQPHRQRSTSWLGNLVYVYGALRALIAWRPARFEIELDPPGERVSISAYTVGACNSQAYGGGMRAAPDALLDDGLLDVVVLESVGKLRFLTRHPAEGVQRTAHAGARSACLARA